jgi:hypothetical protein
MENGKQWFGAFTSIEPGKTGELVWQFYLAPQIAEQISAQGGPASGGKNSYSLLVQKQSGTIAHALTLDLNFGNQIYNYKTDLRLDREFKIDLK